MSFSIDRRTRRESDARFVTPDEFLIDHFPSLVERHGDLVVQGIRHLDARPLAVEVGDRAWTFSADGGRLVVSPGVGTGAVVVTLSPEHFSEWVQQQRTFNALIVGRDMRSRDATEYDLSLWDSLWLTLLEGWPIIDDDLTFVDRHGDPLDLGRSFTAHDDPADLAHFIREAGYVHLRGWIDRDMIDRLSDEIDAAVPHYREGDGRSWWATTADGTRRCVRIQDMLEFSPTSAEMLRSDRWRLMRETLAAGDPYVQKPVEGRCIEALIKPIGVVSGPSDVSFHRDCHFGRHAYRCSGLVIGVAITPSSPENGMLRVVAGSHRVAMPVEVAKRSPYLPVVGVPVEPGDITVHTSCTLHEATPPRIAERKVMYGSGFQLAPYEGDVEGGQALSDLRERVFRILDEPDGNRIGAAGGAA